MDNIKICTKINKRKQTKTNQQMNEQTKTKPQSRNFYKNVKNIYPENIWMKLGIEKYIVLVMKWGKEKKHVIVLTN